MDYFWFQKFLDLNRNNSDLQTILSFIKEEIGERRNRGRIFESPDERNFSEHLGLSITNLDGKVTIKMTDLSVLPKMKAVLPEDSYQHFLNQVEFIWNFGVTSDLIDLERRLPRLKITKIDPVDCERDLDLERMTYPQGLEELTFYTTLPARHRLPESLKILNLHWFSCNSDFMSETITVLRNQCPNLETLNVQWKVVNDVVPVAQLNNNNNELLEGFQCLRSLAFTADIFYMIHSQAARDVIVNSFPWESMKLECLALSVGMKETEAINVSYIKVFDRMFLMKLYSGLLAHTLIKFAVPKHSVTVEGREVLKMMRVKVQSNCKRRETTEKKGDLWKRHTFPDFIPLSCD